MKWYVKGIVLGITMKWTIRGIMVGLGYSIGYRLNNYRFKKIEEKNKQLEEDRKKALFAIVQVKTRVRGLREALEKMEDKEELL